MRRLVSWITEYSYRKAWLVVVAVLAVALYGLYTVFNVRQELIPDIEFPLVTVIVQVPDSQASDISESVTVPLEERLKGLDGVKSMESTTVAGLALISLEYDFGSDLDAAENDIQAVVDSTRLPAASASSILTFDPTLLPIVDFSLQGDLTTAELLTIASRDIVPQIESIDGVAAVSIVGGAAREVVVSLDAAAFLASGLTYNQITGALADNNVLIPSGEITADGTRLPIETVVMYQSLDDIRGLQLRAPDGSAVMLGDIATVEEGQASSTGVTRADGQPAVAIRVTKEKNANTVETSHAVTDALEEAEAALPDGTSLTVFQDQAEFITESINGVVEEGLIGGILAIVIVFIFLANWRTTLVTAVSIPLSIVIAVVLLDRLGYSLNIMTLGGLTIAIGRVIDDSIVVLENVYRHMAEGEEPFPAIITGAREVTIAIVGATATTCAVFLPLGLVGGLVGELFLSFSLAVVFALIASLVVAVTVIPVLTKLTIAGRVKVEPGKRAADTRLARAYAPILRWSLRNRWKTLGLAGAAFVASLALVPLLPVVFLPPAGENIITVTVNAKPGQTQEAVLAQATIVEDLLDTYDVKAMQTIITGAGSDIGAIGNILGGQGANSATITIEFASGNKDDIADDLRTRIAQELPAADNLAVSATGGGLGPPGGIAFTVSAETEADAPLIADVAAQVADAVRGTEDTANVKSDVGSAIQTLQIIVDPQRAFEAGISPQAISELVSSLSSNASVTSVDFGEGPLNVRVLVSGGTQDLRQLAGLELVPGTRISDIASVEVIQRQERLTRVDGQPGATISADVTGEDTAGIAANALSAVNRIDLPDGIIVEQGGIASDIEESFSNLFFAIIASVIIVYVVMVLLFRSWLDPFVILFSLPLAVIGAIIALVVTGSALSVSALIGLLMLVGIVVTNAIVMLEFVIMLRHERGYSTYDAIVEGAQTRLRPILMTAIAAMLALIPLSLGLTEGALIAADLGRVVIGGLFTSTILTLVVVPVIYSLVDDLKRRFARGGSPELPRHDAPTGVGPSTPAAQEAP
ncbi:MAG: efflux RND transporter permease subunit [Tepidiformaceae bacterium]